ncbi:MAG TPA: ABC transporter permease [Acetobacteraceae bacterium]|jgi:peptide/nickel transport system permease protein|nr:ABC transporter permease [Acetobacteraceae bacterium]
MSGEAQLPLASLRASARGAPPVHWLPRALRHRSLAAGLVLCIAILALVIAAPLLASADPNAQDPMQSFAAPSAAHPMGADAFGRDIFARVLYGGRTTILACAGVVLLGGFVGTIIGLVAGYAAGATGFVLMRLVDLLLAFPGILLALVVCTILGPGLVNGVFAIAVVLVPIYARLVEGATREVRHMPYVDAALTLGASVPRIIAQHVLPNVAPGIIVLTTTWLGIAALWIAALGFLGLGVQPPAPEWGAILNDGANYITVAWWITVFPGLFLSLFVIGVNLVGDGLRDELDPTLSAR